jgi:hypothetical protein
MLFSENMNDPNQTLYPCVRKIDFYVGGLAVFYFRGTTDFAVAESAITQLTWGIRWKLATTNSLEILSMLHPEIRRANPIAALGSLSKKGYLPTIYGESPHVVQVRFVKPVFLNYGIVAVERFLSGDPSKFQ